MRPRSAPRRSGGGSKSSWPGEAPPRRAPLSAIARRLQADGYDVIAAASDTVLADLGDEDLLPTATQQGRAIVTENVDDFARIARNWGASEAHHAGLVMTSWRRYRRGRPAYPGDLIAALRTLLDAAPESTLDSIIWLP